MNRPRQTLPGLLCLAVLASAFCIWSALGNEVNICVTSGCALFQDTSVAGVSLWWFGGIMFAALAAAALLGAAQWGVVLAGLALLGDTGLLLLMSVTAPCVSCLIVAALFALIYAGFRQAAHAMSRPQSNDRLGRSALLLAWGLLFIVNVGTALRTQADVWPITDNGNEASVRMFFSPSCPSCREGIDLLSGHVDVAFYPLAENDSDIYKVARMMRLMDNGSSVAEALAKAQDVTAPTGFSALSPAMLRLRLHMLRNKAHVFMAGSQSVPFFEYHGLPAMLKKNSNPVAAQKFSPAPQTPPPTAASPDLPIDPQIAGECSGTTPCR